MDFMEFLDELMTMSDEIKGQKDPDTVGYCMHCNKAIKKDELYVRESMDLGTDMGKQHIGSFLSHYECTLKGSLNMFKEMHFKGELNNGTCSDCHKTLSEDDRIVSEYYTYDFYNLGDKASEEYKLDFDLNCYKNKKGVNIINNEEL